MANRMKSVLKEIISEEKSAFVSGRQIRENIVAHELFHFLKTKSKRKKTFFALKIDISKAYDHLEWSFIVAIMREFGFCDKWIDLTLASLVTFRVKLSRPKMEP